MGKEFKVNTLEEMCDLMCGKIEEDEEDPEEKEKVNEQKTD